MSTMRKRAREELTSINRIYDDALQVSNSVMYMIAKHFFIICIIIFLIQDISSQTNSEGIIGQLPSMQSMKLSLYRARRERLPPMPRSHAELNLTGDWAKTLDGQDFVLANDGQDDKIVLFGTESSLKLLSEANTYYVDWTFRVTPSISYQLFTIHIVKHNQSFPLVYALLPNKQRQTYSHVFLLLKDAALSLGITLNPDTLMSDFELALIQATVLNFPNASQKGCYYHFKQAIWRKVQSLGLVEEYKSSDEVC